ncbi:nuclear pore complex protein Nup98-Nup96 isoform X2 [Engraulis encrasicolus]|uniref:nuclear pore complex protein Nup98-Nup96 isoform X2 n=1 Tax=Engraulis encrasicolus TaxID=184585 RepID=UPI002FCE92C3
MFNKTFGAPFGGGGTGGFGTTSTFGQQQTTSFGAASGFGSSAFGATNATSGLFGATQNKPGGLFGSSTFSQPVTSSTSSGFGFGGTPSGASNSLFGNASTGGGGLFSQQQQSNAFGAAKPTSFGTFGTNTSSSGGLFGATANATANPFGGASGGLFGASSFTAAQQQQPGTTIKFNPPTGSDTMVKGGVTTSINTKHQCITAMKEYENKSLEELRLEDYQAGRKGPSNTLAAGAAGGLFGGAAAAAAPSTAAAGLFGSTASNTGFSFGNKTTFGATGAGGFGAAPSGSLFGAQQAPQQQAASLFKPFGGATTTQQNTGFSFGNTNTLGQPQTSSMGLFGPSTAVTQAGGLFGSTAQTSTATGFGAGSGLFGQPNAGGFGAVGTQNLFGNKPGGFGATTTSAPSFGTGTGLFGNKPTLTLGTNTSVANFGFGANPAGGSLFGNKTVASGLGTGLGAGFGAAVGTGTSSLFGNNQNKLGSTLGTVGAFGPSAFNSGTGTLGLGAPQQPVALTDPSAAAAQQAVLQQQINALAYSPFGDSPLFRNPLSDPNKKEERLKPTNPAAQKALITTTHYKLTPRPATRVRPKALTPSGTLKSVLFDGLDDDEPSLTNGTFVPRKNIKKLVLKNLSSSNLSAVERDVDDLASPPEYPLRSFEGSEELNQSDVVEDSSALPEAQDQQSNTVCDFNLPKAAREAEERNEDSSSEPANDDSMRDDGVPQEVQEEDEQDAPWSPHPAGIVLSRVGYYTIPSLDELSRMLNENGECLVENFTIGRKGYGSVFFPGTVNLTDVNLDEIVHFRRKEIIIYPDDMTKPAVGEGLNRRAEVTLDGVWPNDKTTCSQIRSPDRLVDMNYEGRLEAASRKQGARFLEYRPETGSWVFEVAHFSKYGLQDSDEEEEVPSKVDLKKAKTGLTPPATGLQPAPLAPQPLAGQQAQSVPEPLGHVSEMDSDMADITQEPAGALEDDDFMSSPAMEQQQMIDSDILGHQALMSTSCHIPSSMGINPHTLQIMKASLFLGDDDGDPYQQEPLEQKTYPSQEKRFGLSGVKGLLSHLQETSYNLPPSSKQAKQLLLSPDPYAALLSSGSHGLAPRASPAPAPEAAMPTVGARHLGAPVPLATSVTQGKCRLLMDAALFHGRSFRVGWGPGWKLVHSGQVLSGHGGGASPDVAAKDPLQLDSFSARPTTSKNNPFQVHVEEVVSLESSESEVNQLLYLHPLDISLKHSTVTTDGPCPFIQPNAGVQALHEFAQWITGVIEDGDRNDVLSHWLQVWMLCKALWGRLSESGDDLHMEQGGGAGSYKHQLERRQRFSEWLSSAAEIRISQEVGGAAQGSSTETIFSYLTGYKISQACKLAQQSGDHRLSLLLSQAAGLPFNQELLALQLTDWNRMQTDSCLQEERLRIYALLAGKPVWQSTNSCVNVCAELDWQRCVAVHLWYMLPPTASVSDALLKYEHAFQGSCDGLKYACAPLPPYLESGDPEEMEESGMKIPVYDICFHLLKLYCDRHHNLQHLLDPSTVTVQRLDYRLCWHLWNVLQALNYTHLSPECQAHLHTSYAAQLESAGHWDLAIFVLLHISNSMQRERAVREMLCTYCSLLESEDSAEKENFLQERLLIPAQWIHEAKAVRARHISDRHQEALHLYHANSWSQCHRLVIHHLAADGIINDNHEYLLHLLEGLAVPERHAQIQDWDISGKVFLDYIHVIQTLQSIQQMEGPGYQLERLYTEVTSLCSRIELLQCASAKDRLAQSEMAKRVANILRAVLTLQQGVDASSDALSIPLCCLAPHIGRLPMPEDYALEELRSLTQSYLRELILS